MSNWQTISVPELHKHWQEWQLVDIRDPNAFAQGHIPGAINLSNDNLHHYVDDHDFDIPLVVVCYVGNSSKGAAEMMGNVGFETVYSLDGGMSVWRLQFPELIEL